MEKPEWPKGPEIEKGINFKVLLKSIGEVFLTIAGMGAAVIGIALLLKHVNHDYIAAGIVSSVFLSVLTGWVVGVYNSKMRRLKNEPEKELRF